MTVSPTEQITLLALLLGTDGGPGPCLGGKPIGDEAHGATIGPWLIRVDEMREIASREIDCMVMWHKADVNNSGTLEGKEATAYLDAIRKSSKKYEMKTVGQLSSTEFMAACKDDAFKISFYRV